MLYNDTKVQNRKFKDRERSLPVDSHSLLLYSWTVTVEDGNPKP